MKSLRDKRNCRRRRIRLISNAKANPLFKGASQTNLPYSEIFKDHLANPRFAGTLDGANAFAEQLNPICGDQLQLFLRIRDGRIEAARFLAYGCPPTLVCGSALAEMVEGMTTAEAEQLTREHLTKALDGLPARKQHAAALAIETLRAALQSAENIS